jgi:hypothetical protein
MLMYGMASQYLLCVIIFRVYSTKVTSFFLYTMWRYSKNSSHAHKTKFTHIFTKFHQDWNDFHSTNILDNSPVSGMRTMVAKNLICLKYPNRKPHNVKNHITTHLWSDLITTLTDLQMHNFSHYLVIWFHNNLVMTMIFPS